MISNEKLEFIADGANLLMQNIQKNNFEDNFPYLNLGDFILSIQGSLNHHCRPKINFYTITSYTHLEVAIFEKIKDCNKLNNNFPIKKIWIQPRADDRFKNFSWIKYFDDPSLTNKPVASYVKKSIVKKIIEDVYSLNRYCFE